MLYYLADKPHKVPRATNKTFSSAELPASTKPMGCPEIRTLWLSELFGYPSLLAIELALSVLQLSRSKLQPGCVYKAEKSTVDSPIL